MPVISRKAQQCIASPMRKFYPYAVEAEARGTKIYHLNIGQPDIHTPDEYFDAVRSFSEPVLAYAPSPGIPALIDAVRGYYARMDVPLDADDVLITTGGSEALLFTLLSVLDEGSEVVVPEPFYPNYHSFVCAAGGTIRPVKTTPEEGYRYADCARIEACINEKTRAILITNPGNPTGVILSAEELRMIAELAREHDLYFICDEVYREFVYGDEPLPTAGAFFPDMPENVVLIDSVSKRFSACGARIGAAITKNRELSAQILKFCQSRLSVATLDQVAAARLYDVPASYFEQVRREYKLRRDTCFRKISEIPGVVCKEPQGAFYFMAALPVDSADAFQKWLLTDFSDNGETVMFAPGEGFYATPGLGHNEVRIAYVLKQHDLERAMELLKKGIAQYSLRSSRTC